MLSTYSRTLGDGIASTNIIPVCKVAPTFHLAPATPPPPRQPIYNLSNVSCCLSITLLENANKRVLLPT